ncbi:MAG: ABC transporter permease [Bacteroidota bacterium]
MGAASAPNAQQFWAMVWRRFRSNRPALWSLRLLVVLLGIAFFADFLANEKPLYCKIEGKRYFPVLADYGQALGWTNPDPQFLNVDWKDLEYERVWWAPVAYSASTIDVYNAPFKGPFDRQVVAEDRFWHWLGTDDLGRDVAAGMLAGTRMAMLVGVVAMSVACFFGIILGLLAGYYGDSRLRWTRVRLLANGVALVAAWFYGFAARSYALAESEWPPGELGKSILLGLVLLVVANVGASQLERFPLLARKRALPVDLLVMRAIEVLESVPGLLFLLAILAVIEKPGILDVMVIIGFLSWTSVARFVRAELLRIRTLPYIEAAQVMGFSEWRIIWRHALPNALGPILVVVAFGVAGAILAEASLSFLGLGLSIDQVSWGSMINKAREDFSAWWLALLPGLAIFATVTIFNLIGDGLAQAMDAKLNQ